MEDPDGEWFTWHNRRCRKSKKQGKEVLNGNHRLYSLEETYKGEQYAYDSDGKLLTSDSTSNWHPTQKALKRFLKNPDFFLIKKSIQRVETLLSNMIARYHSSYVGENISAKYYLRYCAFGLGEVLENRNSLPQWAFYTALKDSLGNNNIMKNRAVPCGFDVESFVSISNGEAEVFDPIYHIPPSCYERFHDISTRRNHHYFSDYPQNSKLKSSQHQVSVSILYMPHVPVELPSILLKDLQEAIRQGFNNARSSGIIMFIGNRIFPEYVKRLESVFKDYDLSFMLPYSPGAFTDTFATFFVVHEKALRPLGICGENSEYNEGSIFSDCNRVIRHMTKGMSEIVL